VTVPDGSGGTVEVGGNFLVVWRVDEAGTWRLHQDIWNDDPAG
jgi:ketosteroid isomerase-like protein